MTIEWPKVRHLLSSIGLILSFGCTDFDRFRLEVQDSGAENAWGRFDGDSNYDRSGDVSEGASIYDSSSDIHDVSSEVCDRTEDLTPEDVGLPQAMDEEGNLLDGPAAYPCSNAGAVKVTNTLTNTCPYPIELWWVKADCREKQQKPDIQPGQVLQISARQGSIFRIRVTGTHRLLGTSPPIQEGNAWDVNTSRC